MSKRELASGVGAFRVELRENSLFLIILEDKTFAGKLQNYHHVKENGFKNIFRSENASGSLEKQIPGPISSFSEPFYISWKLLLAQDLAN